MAASADIDGEAVGRVLAAVSDAVAAITADASLERVLNKLVTAAQDLAGATYAAVGVPESEGDTFARFITVGMSDELVERLGPLPRTHGLLAAMLTETDPHRTQDITQDPRFRGWWPEEHPNMRSFLGVPIVARGRVIGAFYLTDKQGGGSFSVEDEDRIALLAAHAAVAIENAAFLEASRTAALADERDRMARELHDALNQSLFGLTLTSRAAASHLTSDPGRAADELDEVQKLARQALAELREVVTGLRTSDLRRDGLVAAIRSDVALLDRVHDADVSFQFSGDLGVDDVVEHEIYRIVQEALTNALRHAQADDVVVRLTAGSDATVVEISDNGSGFEPDALGIRSHRLGLTSMEERATAVGGTLEIDSGPDAGTTVRLRVPHE
ncbi:MAG: GAF domain-containing sensor histidine kinase [Actinobacteria bacterium]|nr:GAF domain-containing sensor histidine kinase [Actinomycetota bacterium]